MTTPMQTAVDAMHASLRQAAGVTVVYTQDNQTRLVKAIPGNTIVESTTLDGAVHTDRTADWIVKITDLGFVPAAGDTIQWERRKYEVMNSTGSPQFPAGGKVYREIGPYKQLYRITSKEVNGG